MPVRLVVFDMAGTTVVDEGVVNRCFRDSLAECGLAVKPESVDAVMGLPKPEAFRLLIGRWPVRVPVQFRTLQPAPDRLLSLKPVSASAQPQERTR